MKYGLSLRSRPAVVLNRPVIVAEVTRDDWHTLALGGSDGWLAQLAPRESCPIATAKGWRFARTYITPTRQFLGPAVGESACEAALLVEWDLSLLSDGVYEASSYVTSFQSKRGNPGTAGLNGQWYLSIRDGLPTVLDDINEAHTMLERLVR